MTEEQNPDLEQEEQTEEEQEQPEEEQQEEESNEGEEQQESELEKLKQENGKLRRSLKKTEKRLSGDVDDDVREKVERLEQTEVKRQFGYQHDLSPDEVDRVFQIDSNPSEKTLEDPFVKAGLDAIRKQKRVDDNTPSSSTKAPPTAEKDFSDLPKNEKDRKWQDYMKQRGVTK